MMTQPKSNREKPERTHRDIFERRLLHKLYRLDCPAPELLRDYHWGYLPKEERQRVAAHLALCPHCEAELADLADFVAMEQAEPSRLLDRARRAADQARLVIARLVSPMPQPAPVLRGETREVLLFDAGKLALSINLEQDATGAYTLFGQVLSPEPVVIKDGYARLKSTEKGAPVRAALDRNGGFSLPDLQPGVYHLTVSLPDWHIVVPTLALKTEL